MIKALRVILGSMDVSLRKMFLEQYGALARGFPRPKNQKPSCSSSVDPGMPEALSEAMDRYADGDTSAFDVLYDELAPRLRTMLRRKRCNPALIEDLIQQTF